MKIGDTFQKGFTLLEILAVLAISLLLVGLVIPGYASFQDKRIFNEEVSKLRAKLQEIRNRAILAEKPLGCESFEGYRISLSGNKILAQAVCNGLPFGDSTTLEMNQMIVVSQPRDFPFDFKVSTGAINKNSAGMDLNFKTMVKSFTVDSVGKIRISD